MTDDSNLNKPGNNAEPEGDHDDLTAPIPPITGQPVPSAAPAEPPSFFAFNDPEAAAQDPWGQPTAQQPTQQQPPYVAPQYAGYQAPYASGYAGQHAAPASGPYTAAYPTAPAARRGRGRTAGILAAALFLGTAGGAAAAAGVNALNDDSTATSSTTDNPVTNSSVSKSPDTPAPSGSIEAVANKVLPSVVKISVVSGTESGSGSGVILSSDGLILTNNHVVDVIANGGKMSVAFNDGRTADATVVGADPVTDLAVIKAADVSGLTPATIGNSDNLGVGESVLAIGSPFGLQATVTSGIVSALNRPVSIQSETQGTDTTYPAIQTDAAINPGNSGGPLVNLNGEVVGINSSIRSSSSSGTEQGGSIGLGFAIPITNVLPVVQQLEKGETPTHAKLGISVGAADPNNALITGAKIADVNPGSSGEKAGLRADDIVTKVDDKPISDVESLIATVRGYRPGDVVTLTVLRDGKTITLKATLDSDANDPNS